MKEKNSIAAIDIGNSRVKLKIGEQVYSFDHRKEDWDIRFSEKILHEEHPLIIGISSVADNVKQRILDIVNNSIANIYNEEELLSAQTNVKYKHIRGAGSDRVFGLIGAMRYDKPPLITIDCGTAVTINAVDSKGIMMGGVIFAGVYTQLKALSENTEKLMDVDLDTDIQPIAKDTESALRSGAVLSVAGAIKEITTMIKEEIFHYYPVKGYVTGGFASVVMPYISHTSIEIIHKKDLVLDGILAALDEINR